jgi:hypothetical protein
VISKKAKEEAAEEARRQKEAQEASAASSTGPTPGVSTPAESSGQPNGSVAGDAQAGEAVKEDWEDEHAAEEAVLQVLVDRLHDKGEKEVTRILKVSCSSSRIAGSDVQAIEYDKRFAGGFPRLQVNEAIRDRVLDFARQEKKMTHDGRYRCELVLVASELTTSLIDLQPAALPRPEASLHPPRPRTATSSSSACSSRTTSCSSLVSQKDAFLNVCWRTLGRATHGKMPWNG